VSLLAFGATGSGKSHSLLGGKGRNAGALPRIINAVFEALGEKAATGAEQTTLHHVEATHCELVRVPECTRHHRGCLMTVCARPGR
jgi:hypothetical protein